MANNVDCNVVIKPGDLMTFLKEQKVKETGAFSKGVNKGLNIAISALNNRQITPAHTAVRRGHWIVDDYDSGEPGGYAAFIEFHCSECGLSVGIESGEYDWSYGDPVPWRACPVCTAQMPDPNEGGADNA